MKKLISKALVLSMAAAAFVSTSTTAEAKIYNYDITEESFPAADYAARYADLKAAYGEDKTALYNHYKEFGAEEGRIVLITKDVLNAQNYTDVLPAKVFAIDVLSTIVNDSMTDAQKVKAVEKWMTENITYGVGNNGNACYHINAPMLTLPTVEEGYAETFEFFMDACGVEAITNSDLKTNKVKVDGVWYDVNIPAGVLY
ncbi:MAG: hypothetical protein K6E79_09185 [Pseudobutyrivibrio sp.]|nr:hypothetical protein [Pseudobutyrivibrio sp.]